MPQTPPQAPTTSAPPVPVPASPPPSITFTVPQSRQELENLRARRQEISNQIENVMGRRRGLARQYEGATGADRTGLQQQLGVLDQRIAQMEADLAESGRALSNSPVLTTSTGVPFVPFFNVGPGQFTGISIVFIVCVLGPLAGSFGRMIWRRSSRPATPPGWDAASQRLERLEQAIDTIAVEMERVSEGQRFITKIMTQGGASTGDGEDAVASTPGLNGGQPFPALGPGAPEPIVTQRQREEVRVRRS